MFYIICKYFIIKLKEQNSIVIYNKRITSMRIRNILHSYDCIYREINEYNTTYWSKFVFNIWLLFGIFNIFLIHLVTFTSVPLFIKIILFYLFIILFTMYIFIMSIASSVNSKANKSHKIFNSFAVKYSKLSKIDFRRKVLNLMKVKFI